ncbi:hypothetical protein CAP35_08280 [Chitinophagaceae bacterium IBVUCB1]|nr:hypothetical protein CAP35_08280 [Chitinophagaceae bacterium IBVUCB1]
MQFYDSFREIEKQQPFSIRRHVRNAVLSGLYLKDNALGMEDLLKKPRVQFLYFHHLFADEKNNMVMLIERLLKHHVFISYSEAVTRILSGTIDKPYIVLSSDDGFKNNLLAADVLNKYSIPACFFINPAVTELQEFDRIALHCRDKLNFPPVEFMNWDDIAYLQKSGHEIGSHTMWHDNVSTIPIDAFEEDLHKTIEIIKSKCGIVQHFAYPYGRWYDFSKAAADIVFKAGFQSCSSAIRGCHINHSETLKQEDLFIKRDHVIFGWNMNHVMWFIANNARNASVANNLYNEAL